MMKTSALHIAIFFLLSVWTGALAQEAGNATERDSVNANVSARLPESESEIMFGVRIPANSPTSDGIRDILENKVTQILGRCGAGAAGSRDVFVVEPVVNLTDEKTSEGLVRNVSSISGELSLTARHRYSDATFYNTTVPLNAVAKGSGQDTMNLLAKSIKPSDAVYVRFVRNARKKVFEYGQTHPEIYNIPDAPAPADTVVVVVAVPVAVVPPADNVNPEEAPAPAERKPEQSPGDEGVDLYFSRPGWKAESLRCFYDPSIRNIHLAVNIIKTGSDENYVYTGIDRAIGVNGETYKNFAVDNTHHDFPSGIPVTIHCYIRDINSNPGKVPYMEISLGQCKMKIRNLSVKTKTE